MSGLSHDMRILEASDSPAARDAIAYFVARIRLEIGALAAALDGVDAIVFTAGIGEHAWRVREAALTGMEWLGVRLDPEANRANAQIVTVAGSPTVVYVLAHRRRADDRRAHGEDGGSGGPREAAVRPPARASTAPSNATYPFRLRAPRA